MPSTSATHAPASIAAWRPPSGFGGLAEGGFCVAGCAALGVGLPAFGAAEESVVGARFCFGYEREKPMDCAAESCLAPMERESRDTPIDCTAVGALRCISVFWTSASALELRLRRAFRALIRLSCTCASVCAAARGGCGAGSVGMGGSNTGPHASATAPTWQTLPCSSGAAKASSVGRGHVTTVMATAPGVRPATKLSMRGGLSIFCAWNSNKGKGVRENRGGDRILPVRDETETTTVTSIGRSAPIASVIPFALPTQFNLQDTAHAARDFRQRVFAALATEEQRIATARLHGAVTTVAYLTAEAIFE